MLSTSSRVSAAAAENEREPFARHRHPLVPTAHAIELAARVMVPDIEKDYVNLFESAKLVAARWDKSKQPWEALLEKTLRDAGDGNVRTPRECMTWYDIVRGHLRLRIDNLNQDHVLVVLQFIRKKCQKVCTKSYRKKFKETFRKPITEEDKEGLTTAERDNLRSAAVKDTLVGFSFRPFFLLCNLHLKPLLLCDPHQAQYPWQIVMRAIAILDHRVSDARTLRGPGSATRRHLSSETDSLGNLLVNLVMCTGFRGSD